MERPKLMLGGRHTETFAEPFLDACSLGTRTRNAAGTSVC